MKRSVTVCAGTAPEGSTVRDVNARNGPASGAGAGEPTRSRRVHISHWGASAWDPGSVQSATSELWTASE
jgi:hypothetical protein